jgi:hypothetical protein
MDVSLTDEQLQWQETVARLAAAHSVSGPADLPGPADLAGAEGARWWADVIALGVPALRSVPHSGVEAAMVESALAVEQAALRLSVLPIVGQGVVGPQLLAAAGADELLNAVVDGEIRVAPAFGDDLAGFGHRGEPAIAVDAAGATHALLLAGPEAAPSLVAVEVGGEPVGGLDLTRQLRRIAVDARPAGLDCGGLIPPEQLTRARAVTLTAFAADLLGVMAAAVEDAVAYAGVREQFGAPVGSFQAVQHLLADAAVAVEGARSCLWHAAWAADHLDAEAGLLAARTAKAYCSAAGPRVVEASVQVFGGMAITWEHPSHLRLRRVHLDRQCFGAEDVHHLAIATSRLAAGAA